MRLKRSDTIPVSEIAEIAERARTARQLHCAEIGTVQSIPLAMSTTVDCLVSSGSAITANSTTLDKARARSPWLLVHMVLRIASLSFASFFARAALSLHPASMAVPINIKVILRMRV